MFLVRDIAQQHASGKRPLPVQRLQVEHPRFANGLWIEAGLVVACLKCPHLITDEST